MKTIHFALPLLLIACSGGKPADTGSDTAADNNEDITPALGDWVFTDLAYTVDGCNFNQTDIYSTTAFESNVYTLNSITDTEAQYVDSFGTTFDCSREEAVITCPSTLTFAFETYNDDDGNPVVDADGNPVAPDATNTVTTEFVTTSTSASTATLSATLTASCAGEDCQSIYEDAGVTDNPCGSTLTGNSVLQE